jgi:hypothetical protein
MRTWCAVASLRLLLTLAAAGSWLAAFPAGASPITFGWTGTITEIVIDAGPGPAGGVGVGSQVSGVYTFESTTPDSEPLDYHGAYYDTLSDIEVVMGTDTLTIPSPSNLTSINMINVRDGDWDAYEMFAMDTTGTASMNSLPIPTAAVIVQAWDDSAVMLSSTLLPVTPDFFDPDAYDTPFLIGVVRTPDVDQYQVHGEVDSLYLISAPESSALTLLMLSLTGVAILRRRPSRA